MNSLFLVAHGFDSGVTCAKKYFPCIVSMAWWNVAQSISVVGIARKVVVFLFIWVIYYVVYVYAYELFDEMCESNVKIHFL